MFSSLVRGGGVGGVEGYCCFLVVERFLESCGAV